ncbi:MAG: anaerobic ribonucleoside-triphosphate reductase [Candidatus Bathyarchaeota archaeon]
MRKKIQKVGAEVFSAVSAPTRIQTLRLLNTHGPLSYSEIMELLSLAPAKDAGKFVYHLRTLLSAGLIDIETGTKKYEITELGVTVVNFAQSLDEYALKKSGKLLVRTSRSTIESFARDKIKDALVKEAEMPSDLADRISMETENRFLKLPVRYLTAPLIREFVNAILIEKGLEEYRHKLTRLGMPIYDVTDIFNKAASKSLSVDYVRSFAGNQVMIEYMLMTTLPREIADAHLSGQIHICNSNLWILKPYSIYHDLRYFYTNGLKISDSNFLSSPIDRPKELVSALMLTSHLVDIFSWEIAGEQTIDYFNIFLAPYTKNLPDGNVKDVLKSFLSAFSLKYQNFLQEITLGLELVVPPHLKEIPAIGPQGKKVGIYQDYEEEARRILRLLVETVMEISEKRPLFNPHLLLKFRSECMSEKYDELLNKAHELAARWGLLCIANLTKERQEFSSYSATGNRIGADWTKDWEVDVFRAGCLDSIAINLPRIAYESNKTDEKFFNKLDKVLETIDRALGIKNEIIKIRMEQGLLPYLNHKIGNEPYYRLHNSLRTVGLIGLNEAVKAHLEHNIYEDIIAQNFALQIVEHIANFAEFTQKSHKRFAVSQISENQACQRLAERDFEKYGASAVYIQGEKENPYYTMTAIPDEAGISLTEKLKLEEKLHPLFKGGHISSIPLEHEKTSRDLLKQTKKICENYSIGLFTYSYVLSYCPQCQKTFVGHKSRCPSCGTTLLTHYIKEASRYSPLK